MWEGEHLNRELSGACCLEWATLVDRPIGMATMVKYKDGIHNSRIPFSQFNGGDDDDSDGNANNDGYDDNATILYVWTGSSLSSALI